MPQIIRDGIRRWWWVYVLAAAGSVFSVLDRNTPQTALTLMAGVVLYSCGALFVFNVATPGKFRALGMFPVTHRQIGLAYGILWVGIVPAFHVTAYLAARLAHALAPGLAPEGLPLFLYVPLLLFSVGMSCAFFMIAQASQYFQPGWIKNAWDFCSTFLLFVLFTITAYFVYRLGLPAKSEPLAPDQPFASLIGRIEGVIGRKNSLWDLPEFAALGVAAAAIAAFFVRTGDCGRFLLFTSTARGNNAPVGVSSWNSDRTYGFMEPWVQEARNVVRIVGVLAVSCAALYCLNWAFNGRHTVADLGIAQWPLILILIAGLVCMPPMAPWLIGIRTLRVLPMSRKGLTLYLISFPLLAFSVYSFVAFGLCMHYHDLDYALNMEWWMLFVFGFSLLSVGPMLMSRHNLVTIVILFLPTIATEILAYKNNHPVETMQQTSLWLKAGVGIPLVAAGYLLLHAVIARSVAYRSNPWMDGAQL